jgi:hypothetical protein
MLLLKKRVNSMRKRGNTMDEPGPKVGLGKFLMG